MDFIIQHPHREKVREAWAGRTRKAKEPPSQLACESTYFSLLHGVSLISSALHIHDEARVRDRYHSLTTLPRRTSNRHFDSYPVAFSSSIGKFSMARPHLCTTMHQLGEHLSHLVAACSPETHTRKLSRRSSPAITQNTGQSRYMQITRQVNA